MAETVFHTDGAVNITNARAVLGGKTYAMSNISSVTMVKKKVNIVLVAILGIIALASLGMLGSSPITTILVIAVCAGLIYLLVRPAYGVVLGSASGESEALVSRDRVYIEKIVNAMNEAIIHRG
jgi:hypothetical protein